MKENKILQQNQEIFVSKPTFIKRALSFRNFLIFIILGFAILTVFAKQHNYFNFDLNITLFIQRYNAFWFDSLMKFVTLSGNAGSVAVLVIMLVLYGYLIGKRHAPLMLIASASGGLFISYSIKILIARPRPDPLLINQIGDFVKPDSFPSGHVLGAVSLYGFLLYIAYTQLKKNQVRKLIIGVCILVIFLMGLSRIYLGAHWFSDVLGAYLIGFTWLSFVAFIYQKLKPKVRPSD